MSITVEEVIARVSAALHLQPSDCEQRQDSCLCFALQPAFGTGECRFYRADSNLCIMVFDCTPGRDIIVQDAFEPYNCIAFFRTVGGFRSAAGEKRPLEPETLYTNIDHAQFESLTLSQGARCRGFMIILDPEEIFSHHAVARDVFTDGALKQMHDLVGVPELLPVLHQLENCPIREDAEMRNVYYSAKIYELLALCTAAARNQRRDTVQKINVSPEDRESITALMDYIDAHLDGEMDQTTLANLVHMSKSKLKYTFKEVTGMTMSEYRGRHRERRACELLRQTQLPVADIAVSLGFSGASSFSRFFKSRLNVTPLEYRHSIRGESD